MWTNPGNARGQIFAIYEWRYVTEDGEESKTKEFCYSDMPVQPDSASADEPELPEELQNVLITDAATYFTFCDSITDGELCGAVGCRYRQRNCQGRGSVNCRQLAAYGEVTKQDMCNLYADCEWNANRDRCDGDFEPQ